MIGIDDDSILLIMFTCKMCDSDDYTNKSPTQEKQKRKMGISLFRMFIWLVSFLT